MTTNLLPSAPFLVAFVVASVALALTPGPGVLYVVTRSLAHGRRYGLASVAGVALGNWCNALGAILGLAALFAISSAAFMAVKWAGGAYLVYLGVRTLRASRDGSSAARPPPTPIGKVFRDGFFVALLNPKTAVFFAAFLPQFMTAGAHPAAQGVALGSLFVAIAAVTDSLYALFASAVAAYFGGKRLAVRGGRVLAGGALIGLGIYAAVTGARRPA